MPAYLLSAHSYVCETGGHAVFLDLKHDRYVAVPLSALGSLRLTIQGWPACSQDVKGASGDDETTQLLLKEGLLTTDPSATKRRLVLTLQRPTTTFATRERPWPKIDRQHFRSFVSAWATTSLMLRVMPIRRIVHRVWMRKERGKSLGMPLDIARARQLTAIHFALQPIFYSADGACLRNSLTLIEFLAHYQIYPTWVFGVKMSPFAAHSWVQHEDIVFNDPIEHVRAFTPIMLV